MDKRQKAVDKARLARRGILDIKPYVPGKPIQEVKRELGLDDVIKLASNENPLGPSPLAVKAIRDAVDQIHIYPDGECHDLRKALSRVFGIGPECFIFGNGGEEIISLIGKAFINEGDACVIPYPVFDAYETVIRIMGGVCRYSGLLDYRIDLDDMLGRVDKKTKLVFICNPMNPTGTIVTRKELDAFLQRLAPEVIVVLDEAYFHFASDPAYPDGIEYVRSGKNVIVLRTFSKVYGLGGIRIGYGVARPDLIELLRQVKEPFNVNVLAQIGALAALQDSEHLQHTVRLIHEEKAFLYDRLSAMGLNYVSTEANFIFIDTGVDGGLLFQRMLERGIIVRPGDIWGLPHFIRLTVGTREQNDRFLGAFKEVLASLPREPKAPKGRLS